MQHPGRTSGKGEGANLELIIKEPLDSAVIVRHDHRLAAAHIDHKIHKQFSCSQVKDFNLDREII